MELSLVSSASFLLTSRRLKLVQKLPYFCSAHVKGKNRWPIASSALLETATSVVLSAIVVGAAAVVLVNTNKASATNEISTKPCEVCCGSGLCSECGGEGFVLKRQSEETAERARRAATNMATRYTAGLPKKWTYCSKCSSTRSCSACGGSGQVIVDVMVEERGTLDFIHTYTIPVLLCV